MAVGLIWAYGSPNPGQTAASFLILPVLCSLLLFKGEPPALLFACVMQWIQATSAVYCCNLKGVSLAYNDLDFGGAKAEEATWLSMIAVLMMAAGMRAALIHWSRGWVEQARQEARLIQTDRAFALYLLSFGVSAIVSAIAPHVPRLAHAAFALSAQTRDL